MTNEALTRLVDKYAAADKTEKEAKGAKEELKPELVTEAELFRAGALSVSLQGTANKIQVQWPEKFSVDPKAPETSRLAEPATLLELRDVIDGVGVLRVALADLPLAVAALQKASVAGKADIDWKIDPEKYKALRTAKFAGLADATADALRKAVKSESSPRLVVK